MRCVVKEFEQNNHQRTLSTIWFPSLSPGTSAPTNLMVPFRQNSTTAAWEVCTSGGDKRFYQSTHPFIWWLATVALLSQISLSLSAIVVLLSQISLSLSLFLTPIFPLTFSIACNNNLTGTLAPEWKFYEKLYARRSSEISFVLTLWHPCFSSHAKFSFSNFRAFPHFSHLLGIFVTISSPAHFRQSGTQCRWQCTRTMFKQWIAFSRVSFNWLSLSRSLQIGPHLHQIYFQLPFREPIGRHGPLWVDSNRRPRPPVRNDVSCGWKEISKSIKFSCKLRSIESGLGAWKDTKRNEHPFSVHHLILAIWTTWQTWVWAVSRPLLWTHGTAPESQLTKIILIHSQFQGAVFCNESIYKPECLPTTVCGLPCCTSS